MISVELYDNLKDFQQELNKWLGRNFPESTTDIQIKGVMEELGELCEADIEHFNKCFNELSSLCRSDIQLKNVMRKIGDICRSDIKQIQGIRGYDDEQKVMFSLKDSIGDLTIFLINYCNLKKISFADCISLAYEQVISRDWKKNSYNGIINDE